MSYSDSLANISDISFDKVLRIAYEFVPLSRKNSPWIDLEHGVKLLSNDDELAQYIAAYGAMHREKFNAALDTIENPTEYFSKNITIIDWGCGQGLATMCFYDYMRNFGIEPTVHQIILVEPSTAAINRANMHLTKYTESASISLINKYIDDVTPADINTSDSGLVLHFFSNILDIPSVNLNGLASLIQENINAEQLFFCVGPHNAGASRIAEFAKLFDITDEDLIGKKSGQLKIRGTISMMVFHIKANVPEVIKVEYYRHRRADLSNNTALNRIIANIPPESSHSDKALQFYRAAVDLERMKSASISDVFYYNYTLDNTSKVKFNIDIQDNPEFEQLFLRNANASLTKWPKHLNIGLSILWENTIYRLLEYVYPFEDLKGIDISRQYISVDLSMFTVCADVADKLELTDDVVDVINTMLADSETSLNTLQSILRDAIGNTLTLYTQISLALTAEVSTLAQINSELKALTGRDDNKLLKSFLVGNINNNVADHVSEDEIINVVDMDESQRHAIATALNSYMSVVTGPPGTGKTQMIVNLLANAMLKNKSVLVASKNNKAVDNIKERFDQIDDCQYLQRFGSRGMIKSKSLPILESLMANIPSIHCNTAVVTKMVSNYNLRCAAATDARKFIRELVRLTDSVPEIEKSIKAHSETREEIESEYHQEIENLRNANAEIDSISSRGGYDWNKISVEIQKNINILQSKNSGISKLLFNLFSKGKYATQLLNDMLSLPPEAKTWIEKETGISQVSDVKNCGSLITLCNSELKLAKRIKIYKESVSAAETKHRAKVSENEGDIDKAQNSLTVTKNRINTLAGAQDQLIATIKNARDYISSVSDKLLDGIIKSRLTASETTNAIARYKNYLPDNIPWKDQDVHVFTSDARNFINAFRLNSVTSLSVKSAFPLTSELFDIVIIDEASQCDVASALPLIYRAKQVVIIGDPLQLKHITSVTAAEERIIKEHMKLDENPLVRYADYSLWDYCNDLITSAKSNNTHVTLDCHYRCHPQIIGYSNEMFYQRKLGTTLKVCTREKHNELRYKGIVWVDVVGKQASDARNVNLAEVEKALSIALDVARQYPNVSIGIISPFKHQAEEINARIPTELRARIVSDTVHKFQGDERDVIIYSMVVTDNSPETKIKWIDKSVPNLVNVAVTRARTTLYIVGNREYIREHSSRKLPLGYLVEYTENKASVTNVKTETVIIDTNVFVNCPDILDRIDPSKQVVISAKVVDELDKLKVTLDDNKKRHAELALRNINRIFNIRSIRMECADLEYLPVDFSRKNPDNMILSVALKYRNQNPILLTSDNGLQLKAKGLGISTISLQTMLNNNN